MEAAHRKAGSPAGAGRRVFLVHGRDISARDEMIALLRAFDLKVISWREAAAHAGGGTPYIGDIVAAGMDLADAVVVLLTPDDIGCVSPSFRVEHDGLHELQPTGQARLNVIFEAGMAMARDRRRVVLVEIGVVRKISDIDGLNIIRMRDALETRKDLAQRLRSAELAVDTDGRRGMANSRPLRSRSPRRNRFRGGQPKYCHGRYPRTSRGRISSPALHRGTLFQAGCPADDHSFRGARHDLEPDRRHAPGSRSRSAGIHRWRQRGAA